MGEVFELEFANSDDDNDDRPTAPQHKLGAIASATRLVLPKLREFSQGLRHQLCMIGEVAERRRKKYV